MIPRSYLAAVAALALVVALGSGPAHAENGQRPPVKVDPSIASDWLLQLSPGSGAVADYRKPHQARNGVVYSSGDPGFPITMDPRASGVLLAAPPQPRPARAAELPPPPAPKASRAPAQAQVREAALAPTQPAKKGRGIDPAFLPQTIDYQGGEAPGTIIIDTEAKYLYHVLEDGKARRYGVGVGKPGFEWAGTHKVSAKREWPDWRPPAQMIAREKKKGRILPAMMKGGENNPLGARAMYLGSTLYRIHGTNQPWTIGKAMSSGCIRMRNEDVTELYSTVDVGTKVIVR
ncbi:L,D-transpeptidase [Consotaella salsifontis]|uniref:Lipoprotein-anchoring transpeptidase ErfK/SrfK n=1 Tax=Consotaella salsifontis TaxID=1365950 RepID=A0A1T4PZJ2_9HYPH|nr:L,D-transpeptidase [Consotaella salsifontis]SJZ96933.1 Lipoprotein-anchoring transpeptidase ErfK/SrfK [Consotaella salsifontis]